MECKYLHTQNKEIEETNMKSSLHVMLIIGMQFVGLKQNRNNFIKTLYKIQLKTQLMIKLKLNVGQYELCITIPVFGIFRAEKNTHSSDTELL